MMGKSDRGEYRFRQRRITKFDGFEREQAKQVGRWRGKQASNEYE